jgi:hypothetical protein
VACRQGERANSGERKSIRPETRRVYLFLIDANVDRFAGYLLPSSERSTSKGVGRPQMDIIAEIRRRDRSFGRLTAFQQLGGVASEPS